MADRDESRDVAVIARGERLIRMMPWNEPDRLPPADDCEVFRLVPHSDLEAAERERDELRKEVPRLVEALGIARQRVEKMEGARKALCRIRTTLDQVIAEFGKGEK